MKNPAKDLPSKITVPEAKEILNIDLQGLSLNPREFKFVAAYCTNGFNPVEALRSAGYTVTRKEITGALVANMTRRPDIIEAVKRFVDTSLEPYRARLEYQVTDLYYRRAIYTLNTFYNDDGTAKPLSEIPEEWMVCVDNVKRKYSGPEGMNLDVEYSLPDRDKALQMLYRMVKGAISEDDPLNNPLPGETRTKLKQIWESIDQRGNKTAVTKTVTKTRPKARAVE